MRKIVTKTLCIAMAVAVSVCNAPATDVSAAAKPAWSKKYATLTEGTTKTYTLKNVSSSYKTTWTSSKSGILKLSSKKYKSVVVKGLKAGKTKLTATVKDKKGKKINTLSLNVTVKKKATPKPTTKPTVAPVISEFCITSASHIDAADFTFTVSGKKGSTSLKDMTRAEIEKIVAGSSISLTGQKSGLTLKANYASYSIDNGTITYKLDAESITKLTPTKNNGKVGSADDNYTLSSKTKISTGLTASYAEVLIGNTVSGFIYDNETKLPLSGVKVTASTSTTTNSVTTDAKGYYRVPVSAGKYTITAVGTENYFAASDKTEVSATNRTGCNMYLNKYNTEELFLYGVVRDANGSQPLESAIVTLYEVAGGIDEAIGTITTDETGMFVFKNSQSKYDVSNQNAKTIKTFKYDQGLNEKKTYKITITKKLTTRNMLNVYEDRVITGIKFGNTADYAVSDAKLTPVTATKSITLNMNWNADIAPTTSTSKVDVRFMYQSKTGIWTQLKRDTITVDVNDKKGTYDLSGKFFFDSEKSKYPTLPSGKYYIILSADKTAYTTAQINLTAGEATVANFSFTPAKTTTVNVACSYRNAEAVSSLESGKSVQVVTDTKGTPADPAKTVATSYKIYQKIGADLIYLSITENIELTYTLKGAVGAINSSLGITNSAEGCEYYVEPVLEYTNAKPFSFVQTANDGDAQSLSANGAASIKYINLSGKNLFVTEEELPSDFEIESISLLDKDGKQVYNYAYTETTTVSLTDLLGKGLSVPSDAVGFYGLEPGEYKVALDLKDFDNVVSGTFSVIDFHEVTATISNKINATQKTMITGAIVDSKGEDIQDNKVDTVDALVLLYNKDGLICGADTYGTRKTGTVFDKTYKFVNGVNAYIKDGETYTVIVRSGHNEGQKAFETSETTVTGKKDTKLTVNFNVTVGCDAGIKISAKDENNNNLSNACITLTDSQFDKYYKFNKLYAAKVGGVVNYLDYFDLIYVPTADTEENCEIYKGLQQSIKQDISLIGIYALNGTDVAYEYTNKLLSGNTYTAYFAADKCASLTKNKITIDNSKFVTLTDIKLSLLAGSNTVTLKLSYSHKRDVLVSVPFDMVLVKDEAGNIVAENYITDTINNVVEGSYSVKTVDVYVPNKKGTYTVEVYSNYSFIASQNITIDGVSTSAEIRLSNAVN